MLIDIALRISKGHVAVGELRLSSGDNEQHSVGRVSDPITFLRTQEAFFCSGDCLIDLHTYYKLLK